MEVLIMLPERRREKGLWGRKGDIFDIEGLFETFLNDSIYPLIGGNIRGNEDRYILEAELPGVKREDIDIDIGDNELGISVKKDEARFEDGILTIILPRKEPGKKRGRKVQIH
jgi:HSP20 family protein